ncbi:MAG TPA: outer membrane beta-barrel protein [Candidatus Solibacter sp.]|nr:outer membrane beta-barrel protein [Candidatus Solibacter sp.]
MHGTCRSLFIAGIAFVSTALVLPAQDDHIETSELSSYVGAGINSGASSAWVGGSAGVSTSKYFMAVLDTSFLPLGNHTLRTGLVGTRTSRLYDFNFDGQILIPLHYRVTPYGLLGAGVLWNTYQIARLRPDGVPYFAGWSDVKFGFQTGGGVRIFVREGFGFRGEYRFTASTQNLNRVMFGVFYQFAGTWPFLPHHKRRTSVGLR